MKNNLKFFSRITIVAILFLTFYASQSLAQTSSGNYAILRIEYGTGTTTILIHYGSNQKTVEVNARPAEKVSTAELIKYTLNVLVDTLNKLKGEGYKVVSSTDVFYVLYKE